MATWKVSFRFRPSFSPRRSSRVWSSQSAPASTSDVPTAAASLAVSSRAGGAAATAAGSIAGASACDERMAAILRVLGIMLKGELQGEGELMMLRRFERDIVRVEILPTGALTGTVRTGFFVPDGATVKGEV